MEMETAEKVAIAKPVASRPACSSFRPFSDRPVGAINASPSNKPSETAITAAIRPRTMRVTPAGNAGRADSSQAELSKGTVCSSVDKVFKRDGKSSVIYKPTAKPVSRKMIPVLTNMQDANLFNDQELAKDTQQQNLVDHQADFRSELDHKFPSGGVKDLSEHSKMSSEIQEDDHKSSSHIPSFGDRASYDGHNWRKYGQKQVKGSEYPRSYYKCTHPNCPVKKKVERFLNGQISEIVYKGEHNHPKPQPLKRYSSDEHLQGNMRTIELKQPPWYNNQRIENERHEGTTQSRHAFDLPAHSGFSGGIEPFLDEAGSIISSSAPPVHNSSYRGGEFTANALLAEKDKLMSKRRKYNDLSKEPGASAEGVKEATALQNATDSTIASDGFRWRKYGQKVVKGNPYPRSYYRCTSPKCNVRKYVERTSDEPNAFITTYEGKHNHEMPFKSTNPAANKKTTKSCGNLSIHRR